MNTHAHILNEAEAVRAEVERALSPELRNRIVNAGFSLTVSSLSAYSVQSGQKPVVTIDERLADQLLEQELTASMAMFRKNVTGVDNLIYISVEFPGHAPRIKVAVDPAARLDPFGDNASVAIADGVHLAGTEMPSRLRKQVEWFLELNRQTLLDYWNKQIDTDELRDRLKANAAAVAAGRSR
jgi:hypothetical protein